MHIRKMDKGVLKFLFHKTNGTASESWGLEGIQAVHPNRPITWPDTPMLSFTPITNLGTEGAHKLPTAA